MHFVRFCNGGRCNATLGAAAALIAKILLGCPVNPLDGEKQVKAQEIGDNTLSFLGY